MNTKLFFVATIFLIITAKTNVYASDWQETTLRLDGVSSLEKTHEGIYAGEFDMRSWLNPYRGIYLSTDLGESWSEAGLQDRGVTGLSYDKQNRRLYASTYYSVFDPNSGASRGGLFYQENGDWFHTGPSVSTASVLALPQVLLLGTNAHGLWVSHNQGQTWAQKIGSGYFGPKFRVIKQSSHRLFVHDEFNLYFSDDWGQTFATIPALKDEKIADLVGNGTTVIAGTSNYRGAFISTNNGVSWKKIQQFEGKVVGKLKYYPINSTFYAYVKDSIESNIYYSTDCITWIKTGLTIDTVNSIEWIFSEPSILMAAVANNGVFKTKLTINPSKINPIFSAPWQTSNESELTDKISTFFDHAYPFLGYSLYSEPVGNATTTTNYLGITHAEPFMYYSSHDGIDFALPFDTQVQAVANGTAQYYYQPNGLGHYIKLTHNDEPYQTVYGHLQQYPSKAFENAKTVSTGDVIGKIGMSGRTTGPHLHFTVIKDLNNDGNFENDIPQGKTDPFGWQNPSIKDPWESYSWTDDSGNHTSHESNYLWTDPIQTNISYTGKNNLLKNEHVEINLVGTPQEKLTGVLKRIPTQSISNALPEVTPISQLAFQIDLFNNFGEQINNLAQPIPMVFHLATENLVNINTQSLKIFHYDENLNKWEELVTTYLPETNLIQTLTNKFSIFAVFGQKSDRNPPQSQINVTGAKHYGNYIGEVTIEILVQDTDYQSQVKYSFIKINEGEWEKYTKPFNIIEPGEYNLFYKSMDEYENMESEKTISFTLLPTVTKNIVKIKNTNFYIN
jgi:murein DD-endopeptidase MepM/ murein hydrolase activator NlpD